MLLPAAARSPSIFQQNKIDKTYGFKVSGLGTMPENTSISEITGSAAALPYEPAMTISAGSFPAGKLSLTLQGTGFKANERIEWYLDDVSYFGSLDRRRILYR